MSPLPLGILASASVALPIVSGGVLSSDSTYYYRTFTSSGTLLVSEAPIELQAFMVGFGGSGSTQETYAARGGGGAGKTVRWGELLLAPGNHSVVLSNPNTTFSNLSAAAGGSANNNRMNGGASDFAGGTGISYSNGGGGGGGGGAGAAGGGGGNVNGGGGGVGINLSSFGINSTSVPALSSKGYTIAGGGGGGGFSNDSFVTVANGSSGGGNGATANSSFNASRYVNANNANTWGSGGGGDSAGQYTTRAGFGSQGFVVVRYLRSGVGG